MSSRTFVAHSPLGEQLEFRSMEGTEQISRLFQFRVRLLSDSPSLSTKSLLGKDMTIEIDLTTEEAGSGKRFLSGQVTQFTYIGRDGDACLYESILRPWLWHATRRSDFKIFQFKKAPEIIKEALASDTRLGAVAIAYGGPAVDCSRLQHSVPQAKELGRAGALQGKHQGLAYAC